jgi:hypothetical protein
MLQAIQGESRHGSLIRSSTPVLSCAGHAHPAVTDLALAGKPGTTQWGTAPGISLIDLPTATFVDHVPLDRELHAPAFVTVIPVPAAAWRFGWPYWPARNIQKEDVSQTLAETALEGRFELPCVLSAASRQMSSQNRARRSRAAAS